MDQSGADHFGQLCEIVTKLRAPGGCPWDREQTHDSLLPALIEEAYEIAGALHARDDANFREIVTKLRAPGGCPWDREQTHDSLLPALIEEAYEIAGALHARDDANFRE